MPAQRRCLVTGANRGLGLGFVRHLLARGDAVIATCRHPGRATALNALTGDHPGRLHVLPLDVGDPRSIDALVHELPLVTDGLDLLVNNAGILHAGERFGTVPAGHFDDSLRTNATGPFLVTQALAPHLAPGARVANISSSLGSTGELDAFRTPTYAVSKAAQNMVTALLAKALAAREVVVLALNPGWVRTDMGGGSAERSTDEAVEALLDVIDTATPADNGRFLDWRGNAVPW